MSHHHHHRANTRSKNKRKKGGEDNNGEEAAAVATAETLSKINSSHQVNEEDVNQLYMIWKPLCQVASCRINTKDNPNCFCGLAPPPNGTRKTGLWQKTSDFILSLGPDPSDNLRLPLSPAGLTNLGATCYANSILQCLYMNHSFRDGIFSLETRVFNQHPVLNQLARLFAQLHASHLAVVDSAPFIRTLDLNNAVQQDTHEFLTLLFSLLQRCLASSNLPKATTLVQDLFRGSVSHVTKCSKCGNESEASSKIEDFYELELNVKGLKSLDESLDDYLSVEELRGDNQYFCESCATRVNATRSIKLRSLPPVLNFQLKRCVFLPNVLNNTTMKKKVTSAFCFPGELDMAHRMSEHSHSELIYDLSAILIHKGSAVDSGHYIAHIKDDNTDQWWEFDDEKVSNLGRQPFGGDSTTKPIQKTEPVLYPGENDDAVIGNLKDAVNNVESFSSSDAYMLMYILRRQKTERGSAASKMNGYSDDIDVSLPSHMRDEVTQLNASYHDSCEHYKLKKESELSQITQRRQEVRSVLAEAPVKSLPEPFFWISTDWLRHWADNITSSFIDNTPIRCVHGKVPVSKVGCMKRFSAKAWSMLFSKYDGGPILTKDDYCIDCLFEEAHTMVSANSFRDRRAQLREVAEAALAGKCLDGTLYYVSKTWLQQWLRRKNMDIPCEADAGPTASIRCYHGELLPEQASGARRLLIPETLWLFICETAHAVKPDDSVGCSVFLSDSEPCPQCSVELTEVAFLQDNIREFKLKQREYHEKLASGKNFALNCDMKYYLVPSSWLSKWRSYVNASCKMAASVAPETLSSVIDLLKCEQHSGLIERPPDLIWKRGAILQIPTADGLTIITANDWKLFCQAWDGTEEKGISAEIELSNCVVKNLVGSCEDMLISGELVNSHGQNGEADSQRPVIKTCPEVCKDCIGQKESCELMRKLDYSNEDIYVCFVTGKEPPKSILEAGNILEPNRRISKRSRKTTFGNSINLKVSGSTSIYELKLMIWESFGVVKENQILHKGSEIIDGESSTLADMNIFPGDKLWVTDSEVHESRDIADELSDQKTEVQKAEEGFRGTLLTSDSTLEVASQACFN